VRKKKVPKIKKKPTSVDERKKKVNLSLPPWLAEGKGGMKKVHPLVHHPSIHPSIHIGALVGAGSLWFSIVQ
jgi:hypothetical protein